MKFSAGKVIILITALVLSFGFNNKCYSQDTYVLKHTQSSDRGSFSVTPKGAVSGANKIKVSELSLSVSGTGGRTVLISASAQVEEAPEIPKDIKAVIKSYADPDFKREVEYKKSDMDGEYQEENDQIEESAVPVKLYLEVTAGGETSTYTFWDKNDLESIVSGINSEYGSNLEVTGEGRAVNVRNAKFEKKITDKTITKRLSASREQMDKGEANSIFSFDINKLEKELIADKIMSKEYAGNFTLIIDPSDMYANGNKIPDSLLPKYRKIMNGFSFEFEDN